MKILIYNQKQNPRFGSLVSVLEKIDCLVGYMSGQISNQDISRFNPDIIIHDIDNVIEFPYKGDFISININDTYSPSSFSLMDMNHPNYLSPFTKYKNLNFENKAKYRSDVIYIGDPSVFGDTLYKIKDLNFKFFTDKLIPIKGYCGICSSDSYYKLYNQSKACLVPPNESQYRLYDIISSNGTPVVFNGNVDQFVDEIRACVNGLNVGIYNGLGIDRASVLKNDTNFDRMSHIFSKIGLNKLSNMVKQAKKKEVVL